MNITVDAKALKGAVEWAARALPSKPLNPVMSGLALDVEDGVLTISGFDYETMAAADVEVAGEAEDRIIVPGAVLANCVGALSGDVELTEVDGQLQGRNGRRRFALPVIPGDDYPAMLAMPHVIGTADRLTIDFAAACVATAPRGTNALPVDMVWMTVTDEGLQLSATDRHQLARVVTPWTPVDDGSGVPPNVEVAFRAPAVSKLLAAMGDGPITLHADGNLVGLSAGSRRAAFTRYEMSAQFTAAIPRLLDQQLAADHGTIVAPRAALMDALAACLRQCDSADFPAVRIALEHGDPADGAATGTVTIRTEGPRKMEWEEVVDVTAVLPEGGGQILRPLNSERNGGDPGGWIWTNPKHLHEVLAALPTQYVHISLGSERRKPFLVRGGSADDEAVPLDFWQFINVPRARIGE